MAKPLSYLINAALYVPNIAIKIFLTIFITAGAVSVYISACGSMDYHFKHNRGNLSLI